MVELVTPRPLLPVAVPGPQIPLSVPKSPTPVVGADEELGAADEDGDAVCPPVGACDDRPQLASTNDAAAAIRATDVVAHLRP
jgi:hypothetical protein